jgi:hypothetical protein
VMNCFGNCDEGGTGLSDRNQPSEDTRESTATMKHSIGVSMIVGTVRASGLISRGTNKGEERLKAANLRHHKL